MPLPDRTTPPPPCASRTDSAPSVVRPTTARAARRVPDAARARALERVCADFRTTISPRSAARLATLLSTTDPSRFALAA